MADLPKGQAPFEHVPYSTLHPKSTEAVIDALVDACNLALAEFIEMYAGDYPHLAQRQTPIRRRMLWACAAAECLRYGSIPAVDALLRMQADADALEGEVNP